MAMDRDKEYLQDWMEGDAVERANHEAGKIAYYRYSGSYDYKKEDLEKLRRDESFETIFQKALKEVREKNISDMEYRREIERQRELDDLQEQERRVTNEAYYTHEKQVEIADERHNGDPLGIGGVTGKYGGAENDLLFKQRRITDDLVYKGFEEFNPNEIAEVYRNMAQQYNIQDTRKMQEIIEQSMNGNDFDANQFLGLVGDDSKKEQLQQLFDSKGEKVTLQDILEFMQPIIENRPKQAQEFMQVAQTEIDVRKDGLHKKTDLASDISHTADEMLTDFVEQSAQRDEIFLKSYADKYRGETDRNAERREQVERNSIKYLALSALKDERGITTEDLSEVDRIEEFVTRSADTREKED